MIKTGTNLILTAFLAISLIGCARHPPKSDGGLAAGVGAVIRGN